MAETHAAALLAERELATIAKESEAASLTEALFAHVARRRGTAVAAKHSSALVAETTTGIAVEALGIATVRAVVQQRA